MIKTFIKIAVLSCLLNRDLKGQITLSDYNLNYNSTNVLQKINIRFVMPLKKDSVYYFTLALSKKQQTNFKEKRSIDISELYLQYDLNYKLVTKSGDTLKMPKRLATKSLYKIRRIKIKAKANDVIELCAQLPLKLFYGKASENDDSKYFPKEVYLTLEGLEEKNTVSYKLSLRQ
jgi:hypothetical protein